MGNKESKNKTCLGLKILVVDDLLPNRKLLSEYCRILGCEGDFAVNGKESVEKIKNNKYDICFMDLQMPEMDGIEATKLIRKEINKDLPIIALTGSATADDLDRALAAGMNDYCMKPIRIETIEEKILFYTKKKA